MCLSWPWATCTHLYIETGYLILSLELARHQLGPVQRSSNHTSEPLWLTQHFNSNTTNLERASSPQQAHTQLYQHVFGASSYQYSLKHVLSDHNQPSLIWLAKHPLLPSWLSSHASVQAWDSAQAHESSWSSFPNILLNYKSVCSNAFKLAITSSHLVSVLSVSS